MTEEIKDSLKRLLVFTNDHPNNDEILYEVVLQTVDSPIEDADFKEAVGEELCKRYFIIYEQLVDFVKYLRKNGKSNC